MPIPTTKYRMYFLTMYNLSPIQKGIQAGHAALEYALQYGQTQDYKNFITNDKTWIVLNGGTSGDMLKHIETLKTLDVKFTYFTEPDLNNSVSAICYLLPEKDWEVKHYSYDSVRGPDYNETIALFTYQFKLAH